MYDLWKAVVQHFYTHMHIYIIRGGGVTLTSFRAHPNQKIETTNPELAHHPDKKQNYDLV